MRGLVRARECDVELALKEKVLLGVGVVIINQRRCRARSLIKEPRKTSSSIDPARRRITTGVSLGRLAT